MDLIKENIQNIILNSTNRIIQNKILLTPSNKKGEILKHVNSTTHYYINSNREDEPERQYNITCVLDEKPRVEIKSGKEKKKGRPKKSPIDKLMGNVMTLVNKYVNQEISYIEEELKSKFGDSDDLFQSHISTINKQIEKETSSLDISEALIKASSGITVENASEIQQALEELPFDNDNDTQNIIVEEIVINGNVYYVDNKNVVYDYTTEERIGIMDIKYACIKYDK